MMLLDYGEQLNTAKIKDCIIYATDRDHLGSWDQNAPERRFFRDAPLN